MLYFGLQTLCSGCWNVLCISRVSREKISFSMLLAGQWALGSRRLLISLYNCIQAPAPGGHHQPLPSLANTGPGWIKLCGYSRRYRAGPHHHREPWGQARTWTEVTSNQEPVSVSCHYVSCSKNHAFFSFWFDENLWPSIHCYQSTISCRNIFSTHSESPASIEFSSINNWNQLAAMDFMCFRFDPQLDKWPNSEHVNCKQWCSSHKEKFLELQLMMLI